MKTLITPYVNYFSQYQVPQKINANMNTNSILFVNLGTSTVLVNNFPLLQYQTLSFVGNNDEVDETTYDINFDDTTGLVRLLQVVRKENKLPKAIEIND